MLKIRTNKRKCEVKGSKSVFYSNKNVEKLQNNKNKWKTYANKSQYHFPVDTRRRFNVYKTSPTSYRRLINVETTSCVYWVRNHLNTILLKMPKIEINFRNSKSEVWIVWLEVPKNEIVQSITQLSVFTHSIFFFSSTFFKFQLLLTIFLKKF